MKTNIAAAVLTMLLLVPLAGNAAGQYRSNNTSSVISAGKVYLGLRYGVMTLEYEDADGDTDLDNLGFMFGGHINDYMAMEFEYTQTVSSDVDSAGEQLKSDSFGIFVVARTTGDLYARARVGYSWLNQDFDSLGTDTIYGLAYGLGVGYQATDSFGIELDYTVYPDADETDRFTDPATIGFDGGDLMTEMVSVTLVWSYN